LKTEIPVLCGLSGTRLARWFLPLWLACLPLLVAQANELPTAIDLRHESERARQLGGPLIILFSRHDCKYCATVRHDYLLPISTGQAYRDRIVVRQIDLDSRAPLIDFHGEKTSHEAFAASMKIKLAPVVAFFGPGGQQLAPAIIGVRLPDFYQAYLEEALDQSIRKLHQP